MTKLLQEQIDQLRHEVCFLARSLTSQQAVVQDLRTRMAMAARQDRPSGAATCGSVNPYANLANGEAEAISAGSIVESPDDAHQSASHPSNH